ncbi:MAG: hypothetical protein U0640_11325 [Phycisphaerales bacterium]
MKNCTQLLAITSFLTSAGAAQAGINLINNGTFETGLGGWFAANQLGSDGSFLHQSGAISPVNGLSVQSPPQGLFAAMTDGGGPGSHVLYQDFVIPSGVTNALISFSLFVNNTATAFSTPTHLDFATTALNQQARVDVLTSTSNPFSTAAADVLQNLFQTAVGSPLTTGYTSFTFDATALFAAHQGETVRLRFAEVDNVNIFNFGVDDISVVVPTPGSLLVLAPVCAVRRRRK